MDYQRVILIGNITRDAERKASKSSDVSFTTFSIGVSDSKDRTTFFPITLFDPLAGSLTEYLIKGRQVLIEGRISVNDKGYFNVIANQVSLGAFPKKGEGDEPSDVAE